MISYIPIFYNYNARPVSRVGFVVCFLHQVVVHAITRCYSLLIPTFVNIILAVVPFVVQGVP